MTAFWTVYAIFFWVLCACAVVCLFALTFVKLTYYKWSKQDREQGYIVQQIQQTIMEKIEETKTEISSSDEN